MTPAKSRLFATGLGSMPSLMELMIVEILGTGLIGAGIVARVVDLLGFAGHPPQDEITWWLIVWFAIGAFFLWLTLRDIWSPGVTADRYSPVRSIGLGLRKQSATQNAGQYLFLASHPAFVFIDLIAGLIPLVLTIYSWGDDPARNTIMHVYHWWLIFWTIVPLARLFCWFGLGRGPEVLQALAGTDYGRQQLSRNYWSGPLVFWSITLALSVPTLLIGIRMTNKAAQSIPLLTAATIQKIYGAHHDSGAPESRSPNHDDERFRIRGTVRGEVKHWPATGKKLAALGFIVTLEDGAEVTVFADEQNSKALNKAFAKTPFTCVVRTLYDGGREVSAHYKGSYDWNDSDLAPPAKSEKRILTYYVDP